MELLQQLQETCDKLNKAWDEFKVENNTIVGKAVKDGLAEAKVANIQQALDDLTGKRADLEARVALEKTHREELERKVNLMRLQPGTKADEQEIQYLAEFNVELKAHAVQKSRTLPADVDLEHFRAYRKAHEHYVRNGDRALTGEESKAMMVGSDPDGGYLVPADYSGQMVKAVWELSPIRQVASVQAISSDRLDGIEDTGEAGAGWVSETAPRPATPTPQIGRWEIVAQEMYAAPQVSQRLLDDAAIDVEAWLTAKVADKFARLEGIAFVSGTGAGQPRGFTTYPTAALPDSTRPWGTIEVVKTGVNAAFAADPAGGDVLYDLLAAFRPPYLANGRWLTRRGVIARIRKMKATSGNYIWQPGLLAGQPDSLAGFPILITEDMPAPAAGSISLAFGDMKQAYQIVDRLGVRTLRDPYTAKPFVIFYTTKRTGGAVLNTQALKFLSFSV